VQRRTTYHHGDLRAALVRAAVELIGRHGVGGFTMADAAKAASVAVSAPYRHFADRESLLAAVAQDGFEELRTRITAIPTDLSNAVHVEEMAVAYVRFAAERRAHFQVMFAAGLAKAKHPEMAAAGDRAFEVLLQASGKLAVRARARKLATTTAALWSLVHGFAVLAEDSAFAKLVATAPPEALLRGAVRQLAAAM